jgi:sec-independent protein translocase protein TatA
MELGLPELLLIMMIVILLFGVGRIGKIAGELGSGIKAFKDGLKGDEPKPETVKINEQVVPAVVVQDDQKESLSSDEIVKSI